VNRTRIADPKDSGAVRLILDTRTGTPASNTADASLFELRRGGSKKWLYGLNTSGDGADSFDFANATGRVLSIGQSDGSLKWSAVGAATDTTLARGGAGGRAVLQGASDTRLQLNTTTATAGVDAVIEYQRGGSAKWQVGLNYAAGTTADTLDFYSGGLALQLTTTLSAILGKTAPATTATDGFPYVPVMAGTPTGVPTAKAGYVPMVVDSVANKLWAYVGGSWKGTVLA